jgi:hypothetical protein
MEDLGQQYVQNKWRLFIDFLKLSFKAVLAHTRNQHHSVPVAQVVHTKSSRYNMHCRVKNIQHDIYSRYVCVCVCVCVRARACVCVDCAI